MKNSPWYGWVFWAVILALYIRGRHHTSKWEGKRTGGALDLDWLRKHFDCTKVEARGKIIRGQFERRTQRHSFLVQNGDELEWHHYRWDISKGGWHPIEAAHSSRTASPASPPSTLRRPS